MLEATRKQKLSHLTKCQEGCRAFFPTRVFVIGANVCGKCSFRHMLEIGLFFMQKTYFETITISFSISFVVPCFKYCPQHHYMFILLMILCLLDKIEEEPSLTIDFPSFLPNVMVSQYMQQIIQYFNAPTKSHYLTCDCIFFSFSFIHLIRDEYLE